MHILGQGWVKMLAHGLMNFVPVVAYHFCLNFPEKFSQPGDYDLGEKVAIDAHLALPLELLDLCDDAVPGLLCLAQPLVEAVEGVEDGRPLRRRQAALAVQRSPDLADVVRVRKVAVADFWRVEQVDKDTCGKWHLHVHVNHELTRAVTNALKILQVSLPLQKIDV